MTYIKIQDYQWKNKLTDTLNSNQIVSKNPEPILDFLGTYKNHSKILAVENYVERNIFLFYFENIQQNKKRQNITKTLKKNKKPCHGDDILERHIKIIKNLFCHSNYKNFNNLLFIFKFPTDLKKANFKRAYTLQDNKNIGKYRPSFRSSRPEVFCKNGALRNFAKFTGMHLCQSLVF